MRPIRNLHSRRDDGYDRRPPVHNRSLRNGSGLLPSAGRSMSTSGRKDKPGNSLAEWPTSHRAAHRRFMRYSKRSLIITISIIVVAIFLGGGSYALFLGGGYNSGSADDINLQKGLVGWWKLDGNMKDATPNNTVCTPPASSPSFTPDRKGRANSAMSPPKLGFDCGQPTVLMVPNVTMSAWINMSSFNTGGDGIEAYGGITQLYVDGGSHRLVFTVHDSNNVPNTWVSPSTLNLGQWYFVAATYDGSTVNLYINGNQVTSASYTGGIGVNHYDDIDNDFLLGDYNASSTGRSFKGSLDDIRVYNRAVTADEAKALYNTYDSSLHTASAESGLVGWWKLNGNLNDSTPYATVCTPQYFSPTFVSDRHGMGNGALNFTQGRLGAVCGEPTALKVPYITMSAWVEPTSWNSNGDVIEGWNGGQTTLYFSSDGHLEFDIHDSSNTPHSFTSPSPYTLNQWYYVAATYDGSNVVLYVNGTAVSTTSYTNGIGISLEEAPYHFYVAGIGSTTSGFIGSLDDIRVYNRALTASEVQQQYNSYNSQISLGGDGQASGINLQKGLMGYWPMNDGSTTSIKDATPYSDNGTVNGATPTTDRKGRANSAYNFNGTSNNITFPGTPASVGSQVFSVSLWAYPLSTSGASLVSRYNSSSPQPGDWSIGTISLGGTDFDAAFRLSGSTSLYFSDPVAINQWHFIVMTCDGTNVKFYVDGQSESGTILSPALPAATSPLTIGSNPNGASYWKGKIDDLRIYSRVLNADEVQALYDEYQ